MEQDKKFKSEYLITYIHIFIGLSILIIIDDGLDIDWEASIFATIFMIPITWLVIIYYKITLKDTSIKGYDVFGLYHTIELNEITKIKPTRIAWLKYVRVLSPKLKRPLWIPLFLKDMNSFIDEIENRSEKSDPLRVYLLEQKEETNINV